VSQVLAEQTGFPEPPFVGTESDTLAGSLERQRATFLWKCADLDRAGLQATIGASTMTLGGLLKHLAYMEDINFTGELAGRDLPPPWDSVDWVADQGWEWRSAAQDTPEQLTALWAAAVDRSRRAVSDALAKAGPGGLYRDANGKEISVRRLLVDMIEEYARHTGHADLIREAVDGRVGEDPPGKPYPYQST